MFPSLLPGLTYLHAFCAAIAWLLAFSLIGRLAHKALRLPERQFFFFGHIVTGLILVIASCAIWYTRGRTMLLPVPLLLLAALISEKKHAREIPPRVPSRADMRMQAGVGLLALILYFVFFSQAFWSLDAAYVKYPSGDLAYYCRLARHISSAHVENRLTDLPLSMQGLWQPYHWGDIWIIPLLAKSSNLSEEAALLLVAFPLLTALFVMGLFSLYRDNWTHRRGLLMVICLCAPLIASFTFFIPPPWKYRFHFFPAPVGQYPKLLLFACLLLWLFHQLRAKDLQTFIIASFAAGLLFVGAFPSLLLISGCLTLWLLGERQGKAALISFTACQLLTGSWCWFLFRTPYGAIPFAPSLHGMPINSWLHLQLFVSGVVESGKMLPYFFVLAAFLYHSRQSPGWLLKQLSIVEIVLLALLPAGLISRVVLYHSSVDSFQFLENVSMVFLPVFCTWCAGLYFNSPRGYWAGAALLLLTGCSIGAHWYFCKEAFLTDRLSMRDYRLVRRMIEASPTTDHLKLVFIKSPIATNRAGTRNSTVFYPMEFLGLIDKNFSAASLNPPALDEVDTSTPNFRESQAMRWQTPIMQFLHANGMDQLPADSAMCAFTRWYHPALLIAADDAIIPDCLQAKLTADSARLDSKKYRVFRFR